jgi:hypothetical protein
VRICSPLNLPATMPEHTSELYSKNISALLELMLVDGAPAPDFSDEVLDAACVTREEGFGHTIESGTESVRSARNRSRNARGEGTTVFLRTPCRAADYPE